MTLNTRSKLWLPCLLCLCAAGVRAQQPTQTQPTPAPTPAVKKANARPSGDAQPAEAAEPFDGASVERMSEQCVRLETEAGRIEVEMFPKFAPESVRGFLNLAATGALDTTAFSRVVRGFVVQGGNLSTRDALTPELLRRMKRTLPDEPSLIKHERGILSMARPDEPNSATTHFFILVSDAPHLDGRFAAFGRIRAGMDVVDAINAAELDGEKPRKPVRLTRAVVFPCPAGPTPRPAQ